MHNFYFQKVHPEEAQKIKVYCNNPDYQTINKCDNSGLIPRLFQKLGQVPITSMKIS